MNAHNLSLYLQSQAINATIQGMIAENQRAIQDGGLPTWSEEHFHEASDRLNKLSLEVDYNASS